MEITRAKIDDIDGLCQLLNELFEKEQEFTPDKMVQMKGLRAIIEFPDCGDILVAKEGKKILGMVNILYTVSTALGGRVAILEDMIVTWYKRDSGIGEQLLKAAISKAKEAGCLRITLLSDVENDKAHRFYERQGFNRSQMIVLRKNLQDQLFPEKSGNIPGQKLREN